MNGQEISKCEEQNDADAGNSKCDLPQFSAKCRKVEKKLNERMDKKLTAKFSQEAPAPRLSRKSSTRETLFTKIWRKQ